MVRKSTLKNLSLSELQEIYEEKLEKERDRLPKLKEQRDNLQAELDALSEEIQAIEGSVPRRRKKGAKKTARKTGRRGRGGGKRTPLPEVVQAILARANKALSPAEITQAVIRRKHPSAKSKSLRIQISHILTQKPQFKRVGRGQYTLKAR